MREMKPFFKNNGEFLFEFGQTLALNKNYYEGITVLEEASQLYSDPYLFNSLGNCYQGVKEYEKSESCYLHAYYLIPHKFYPLYLLAKLYQKMGKIDRALIIANEIINKPVKIPSTAIREMKDEMETLILLNRNKNLPIK